MQHTFHRILTVTALAWQLTTPVEAEAAINAEVDVALQVSE